MEAGNCRDLLLAKLQQLRPAWPAQIHYTLSHTNNIKTVAQIHYTLTHTNNTKTVAQIHYTLSHTKNIKTVAQIHYY